MIVLFNYVYIKSPVYIKMKVQHMSLEGNTAKFLHAIRTMLLFFYNYTKAVMHRTSQH